MCGLFLGMTSFLLFNNNYKFFIERNPRNERQMDLIIENSEKVFIFKIKNCPNNEPMNAILKDEFNLQNYQKNFDPNKTIIAIGVAFKGKQVNIEKYK